MHNVVSASGLSDRVWAAPAWVPIGLTWEKGVASPLKVGSFLGKVFNDLKISPKPKAPITPPQLVRDLQRAPLKKQAFESEDPSIKVTTLLDRKASPSHLKSAKSTPYAGEYKRYKLPPQNLLTDPKKIDQPTLKKDLEKQATRPPGNRCPAKQ